jgi:hypothetical protein
MFKNNVFYGLAWGIAIPLLTFGVLYGFYLALIQSPNLASLSFRFSTIALFSICANLVPVFVANKRKMDEFIRGIMFPTVLGSFVWFFIFDPMQLFGS